MKSPYVQTVPGTTQVIVLGVPFPSPTVAMRDVDALLRDSLHALGAPRLRLMAARIELSRLGKAS